MEQAQNEVMTDQLCLPTKKITSKDKKKNTLKIISTRKLNRIHTAPRSFLLELP